MMVSAVLGDKTDARPETMAKFLESGCMHVFAVSGMHVGVAAMLVLGMLRLLHVRPRAARLSCILLLAAYVFVTGMSASALRAFIMTSVWLLAFVLRRKGHPANILALAFILLCLMNRFSSRGSSFLSAFLPPLPAWRDGSAGKSPCGRRTRSSLPGFTMRGKDSWCGWKKQAAAR